MASPDGLVTGSLPVYGAPFDGTRYRLVRALGRGGMSRVYLAVHAALELDVVVKFLSADSSERPDLADRMRLEGQTLARLHHPNVVRVTDAGRTSKGIPFLVMERLVGKTLAEDVGPGQALPAPLAVYLTGQLLAGLGAAHAAGVIHRDVKLSNVMVCEASPRETGHEIPQVKLIDFGIAKLTPNPEDSAPAPLSFPTEEGSMIGSPIALSPEQARGLPADARSDLYAVGLLLYRLLAGAHPFVGCRGKELLRAYQESMPQPASSVAPQLIAPELDAVLARALATDPAARFASAEEFAAALTPFATRTGNTRHESAVEATPNPGVASAHSADRTSAHDDSAEENPTVALDTSAVGRLLAALEGGTQPVGNELTRTLEGTFVQETEPVAAPTPLNQPTEPLPPGEAARLLESSRRPATTHPTWTASAREAPYSAGETQRATTSEEIPTRTAPTGAQQSDDTKRFESREVWHTWVAFLAAAVTVGAILAALIWR